MGGLPFDQTSINELLTKLEKNPALDIIEELYVRENFFDLAHGIQEIWPNAEAMVDGLTKFELNYVSEMINWHDGTNHQRTYFYAQKILGALRVAGKQQNWGKVGAFLEYIRLDRSKRQ
ncbi:hypothetical protein [Falsiphaeobacter marinintestinus]|uniref:hypothetical protein n=1 Tax=Falsiphaeobacter marinintestinus TaxID=1492905 RepID=UPI0011B72070|nr:hypothetical protein [Phaeobacter marinintestinus]